MVLYSTLLETWSVMAGAQNGSFAYKSERCLNNIRYIVKITAEINTVKWLCHSRG